MEIYILNLSNTHKKKIIESHKSFQNTFLCLNFRNIIDFIQY